MLKKDVIKLQVKNILKQIFSKKKIDIDKIVIFGSLVNGKLREDSDIDVIIVSKDFRGKGIFERVRMTTGVGSELVRRLKMPVDIMYYSDEEWDKGDFLIINEAKEKGEFLINR